ncbi:MAG: D-glycerate dehydrogenase [Propionivibrio sp.]
MNKFKVIAPADMRPAAHEMLEKTCEVKIWEHHEPMFRELLYEWIEDADGMYVTGHGVKINSELLAHAPKLRVIAQAATGYENADLDACSQRKIPFSNTPGVLVEATADLTFGILLSAARRIHEGWDWVRSGNWAKGEMPFGVDLFGKTLGIVGMGRIGAAVARRAQASGMQVVYHNRSRREDDDALNVRYLPFDELLASADFVTVMLPFAPERRGMFGAAQFARMKQGAYFVNSARGGLVDTDALGDALRSGQLGYAALDVTDPEPLPAGHPLLQLPNVLVTPHIGSATAETRDAMARLAAENLLAGLARKPLPTCVNQDVNYR